MRAPLVAVAACCLAILSGCSDYDPGAKVDPATRHQVEVAQGDCSDLQVLFNGADLRGDTDALDYIDDTMRSAGCYE